MIKILNTYIVGSSLYGTTKEDSDLDQVRVVDKLPEVGSYERIEGKHFWTDINYYTEKQFQMALDNHDIIALECYFSPDTYKSEKVKFTWQLNKAKLRSSISTIVNNSWVKGKKKLTVAGDYDKKLALKSIFHSIRINGLGIQIASEGKIVNFKEYNWLYEDLLKLGEEYDRDELWGKIHTKYHQKVFNEGKTKFRNLCPKEKKGHKDKENQLKKILKRHGIAKNTDLVKEIMGCFYN